MTTVARARELLATKWRSVASGPFFELAEPPGEMIKALPREYAEAIGEFGGREGFLGGTYVRLYRLEELGAINVAYGVDAEFPGAMLLGSNGGGDGFAFVLKTWEVGGCRSFRCAPSGRSP